MAQRIDYYDDPSAPPANTLVPSANVIVLNDASQVLVIHRTDNDNWAVPGGAMELGETLSACGVRETKEETGVDCEITGLVGIYTDPKHVMVYTSDGEARQEFSVLFTARAVGGEPTPSDESREVLWVSPDALSGLKMDLSMRFRIQHWLDGRTEPHLG
jgi:ADP-ribose pyrophosphatase YjhB (NUDIX family)